MKSFAIWLLAALLLLAPTSCRDRGSDIVGGAILSDLARQIDGRSMRATSTKTGEDGKPIPHNSDNSRIMPGESKVVLDVDGPGVVTHMWFTFLAPGRHPWATNGSATHQEMLLRVFYDGREVPDIEVPFGDFFANCFGKRAEVISLPVIVEDADSYNSFWPMPFRKSIRIEVVNQCDDKNINLLYFNIDWIKKDRLPKSTPYFYARYRQEYPAVLGSDYLILETEGKGHYVGTVMAVRTRSPSWFGEGDEKIYIDGEEEASIWGTGTEDYFLSAWGLQSGVNTPYFGTVYFDQWGIVGGHTSAYRWHLADPVVFNKKIRVTIEHYGWISPDENVEQRAHSWNEREDDFATVAFWYQTGIPTGAGPVPSGKERVLPSLDQVFPASAAIALKTISNATGVIQDNLDHYMDGQLLLAPTSDRASVVIPFTVGEKKPTRLLVAVTKAPDYGIWQAYLNGIKVGPTMNLYDKAVKEWEHHLLDFWPDPGEYRLELRLVGKDHFSSGNLLGIESVRLRERRPRVAEFAYDRDNDWKAEPKLYD
ncbi:MAG: glycoside hydrolase family 172 protein [Bacteroidales bacterium]